jgi:hypothetical protein
MKRDKYKDDYPSLVGEPWEVAMDKMGHNVTSHINESGPCEACNIGDPIRVLILVIIGDIQFPEPDIAEVHRVKHAVRVPEEIAGDYAEKIVKDVHVGSGYLIPSQFEGQIKWLEIKDPDPDCTDCKLLVEAGYDPEEVLAYHNNDEDVSLKYSNDVKVQTILRGIDRTEGEEDEDEELGPIEQMRLGFANKNKVLFNWGHHTVGTHLRSRSGGAQGLHYLHQVRSYFSDHMQGDEKAQAQFDSFMNDLANLSIIKEMEGQKNA